MKVQRHLIPLLTIFLCVLLFQLNAFSQAVGVGGLSKPISSSLGGLVNSNVFKNIKPPKPRPKIKTPITKKIQKTSPVVKVTNTTNVSKSKKIIKGKNRVDRKIIRTDENISVEEEVEETQADTSELYFNPVAYTGTDFELAKNFTNNKNEQDAFLLIFKTVKTEFEKEAIKDGRENNVALALTFFVVATSVVYHDSPEPSEEAIEKVYQSFADSMVKNGNLSSFSDLDKQIMSEKLVYTSGVVLFGYTLAKQTKDKATLDIYRVLAGLCLRSLMNLDPDKVKIDKNGFSFSA
jgi:hypothetical protein